MPNQQDQQAIDGLFDRIETVAQNSKPRDREAEALIQQRLRGFPPAPYYMAQTIIIQERALREAQERIEQLEGGGGQGGGFLDNLSGDSAPQRRPEPYRGPWGRPRDNERSAQGGGFLAGAAQTALGVTGGVLLGSAIAGMLTGGVQAQEAGPDTSPDQGADQEIDGGDDFGDGGFDIGGDF